MGVVCDRGVCKGQNRLGRAVILLQFVDLGIGINALKPQDIFDLRAPPAVDGLIVVAYDKEIAVDGREALDDLKLHGVGVLKLVHVDIAEPAREILARLLVLLEKGERLGEEVVKIQRIIRLEVRIVLFVHFDRRIDVALEAVTQPVFPGRKPQHLGVGDVPLDRLQLPVLVLEAALLERLFDDGGALLLGIDGEVRGKPALFGEHPQNLDAHGVNGAHPHAGDVRHRVQALAHLVCRLVGEGDGENILRGHPFFGDEIGNAGGEHARLAAPRARQNQNCALGIHDGRKLFFVEQ